MTILEAFRSACSIDWGTVPQWLTFIATVLTLIMVWRGFYITAKQLSHNQSVRDTENILSVSDSTIARNAEVLGKPAALKIIAMLHGLNVPESDPDAEVYWAARDVHLTHINLIWRVWELGDRPGSGECINSRYDGWERFAREIVAKKLLASYQKVISGEKGAADLAGSDVWSGMQAYECGPKKFVGWLQGLAT